MKPDNATLDRTTDLIYVTAISWERIFLHITIRSELPETFSFKLRRFQRKTYRVYDEELERTVKRKHTLNLRETPIEPESYADGVYTFTLNTTCLDGRQFLDNGTWQIQAYTQGMAPEEEYTCSVSHDLAYQLDDKSRIFRYGGGKYAYNMSFSTFSDSKQFLSLIINSHFMIENDHWQNRDYVEEALTDKGRKKRRKKVRAMKLMCAYYKVVERLSPKKGNKVMFMTETKDYLWGNLKYINDRMIERGLDKQFEISYSLRKAVGKHASTKSWIKLITQIAKQDYIFVDDYVPVFGFLDLNPRTKLIQVWHAGEGFKAVGYCRFGKTGTPFPSGSCHKKYDYVITGSEHLVHIFEEVFGIPKDAFLPIGMARLDGFLDPDKIAAFKTAFYQEHPDFVGKKLILFAPTYRGKGQGSAHYKYEYLDMDQIYEFCKDEYIWAFKMHPFIKSTPPIPEEYGDRIVNIDNDANINDLYYVTDLLITDYSSNYFEYALLEKPVLFYTYDREIYELTRGVHRSVKESAPGKVCDSFEEMMEALRNQDFEEEKIHQFVKDNFKNYDGKASDKAIDIILLGKEPGKDE